MITVHVFSDTGYRTFDKSRRICRCGQIETHRIHDVPATPDDARTVESRMLGEQEFQDDRAK